MKQNRRNLLMMTKFSALGSGMIGIFFPFFVAEAFGFNFEQLLWWDALFFALITVLIYPLNKILSVKLSQKHLLQLGLICEALFWICLSLPDQNLFIFWLATLFHVSYICLFWPHFNYQMQHATDESNRGNFSGNLQSIVIGANLLTPLISGYLFDQGLEQYLIFVAIFFFGISILFSNKISTQEQKLGSMKKFRGFFQNSGKFLPGMIARGLSSGLMSMIWPIYLKTILVKFTLMGIVTSFAAFIEIFIAKITGYYVDKRNTKQIFSLGVWSRMIDLLNRVWLSIFPTLTAASVVTIMGAILGPIFQIQVLKRESTIADRHAASLDFWIGREVILNTVQTCLMAGAAIGFHFWGTASLWVWFVVVGLSVIGFRRYE